MRRYREFPQPLGIVVLQATLVCLASLLFRPPEQVGALAERGHMASASHLPVQGAGPLADVEISVDEIVIAGLRNPVQVTDAGDGSGRLFVVEQPGWIMVAEDGLVLPTPFLDLSDESADAGGEQGLLGLAFHPEYETNGFFYVNYTRALDDATVIARYQISPSNKDRADPNSAVEILTVAQPYRNHNGGQLLFGPDGYLYIGMGDGGSGGDPHGHGQNPNTLLGAMLRLDVDGGTPYAIPPDNPYASGGGRAEVWATGLRNPWRFGFDRANGDLYIGDVGQNKWEEIDYQAVSLPGGVNYGWSCKEGSHDYDFSGDCPSSSLTGPIAEYSHGVGQSITGGFVYRGLAFPALQGRYFYADFVQGKVWSMYKTGSSPDTWSAPELELDTGLTISAFGEDGAGELYVVGWGDGTIRRLADASAAQPDLSRSRKRPSTPAADPGETVTYTIELINSGRLDNRTISVVDAIPQGLAYVPASLASSHGSVDDQNAPTLSWQGNLVDSRVMTITYQVEPTGAVTRSLINEATIAAQNLPPLSLAAALYVPRSVLTTTQDNFFVPGTQPENLNQDLTPSLDCNQCHSEPIYDRWRGSMMAQAGRDPIFWAALAVANVDAPNSGDYCLRCHTPMGWHQGRSHPSDGSALLPDDMSNGVACALCHRLVDPIASSSDEAVAIDQTIREALTDPVPEDYAGSGALVLDPEDRRRGPFSFSPALSYHPAYQTDFFRQDNDAVSRSRLCGSCHNVDNPALSWDPNKGQFWPNPAGSAAAEFHSDKLFPVERTFSEWLYSDYASQGVYAPTFARDKQDGIVSACQDCHLPRMQGTAADPAFEPVDRDCQANGCLPEHTMVGGNAWMPELLQDPDWRLSAESESSYLDSSLASAQQMLRKAATLSVTLTSNGSHKLATARITNHTGHKLPTGYPEGRRMWLNLRAFDGQGTLIFESGAYHTTSGTLEQDPDLKVYECLQGITPELANVLGKETGESFHFVLNNTTIKDNRIPPKGYSQASYDRPGLRPVGASYADGQYWDDSLYSVPLKTEKVIATLYYQTSSQDYVQFLEANGGVDGRTLAQLWQKSKSPPQLMDRAWTPGYALYLPLVVK